MSEGRAVDREKAALLFKLRRLIGQKYELDHDDLLERLRRRAHRLPEQQSRRCGRRWTGGASTRRRSRSCSRSSRRLKEIVTSEERTEGVEDIYHKRHIAVGIPSMYGRYREEKFEAVGLTFRIESMANVLFERMVAEQELRVRHPEARCGRSPAGCA